MNLIVCEGQDLTVTMTGKGVETPVTCDQDMELIDFGTIFTTHTEPREIIIKNHGQQARRIAWSREGDKKSKKEKEKEAPPEPNAAEPERPATKETDRAAPSEVSELKEDPNTKQPEVTPEAAPEATHAVPEQPIEEVDEVDADAEAA